ncbi:MAG: PAS domain S-box protein [Nitriliruptoraceae bacterium]
MLDALPERIARYRQHDLLVLYCNAAKAADYGMEPADLIGREISIALGPDTTAELRAHLAQLGPERPLVRETTQLIRPGQEPRWIEWVEQWIPGDGDGEVLSVGRDVTDERRRSLAQAESEERFRVAMADAPIGMAIVGLDQQLLEVNSALCELLGRTEEELLQLTTLDVMHPDDVDADLADSHGPARTAPPGGLQRRYVRPDGSIVWGLFKASVVTAGDGSPRYIIAQVVDITSRVEQEDVLRHRAADEHLIANRLRELDRVKNTFLTAVSHELRTPLTVVRGMAATLRRLGPSIDPSTRDTLQLALERQADQLGDLLDELFDVDRLARGTLSSQRREMEVVQVVRRVIDAGEVRSRTTVDAPDELWTVADETQIERIVTNLLENTAKYAPGSHVEVRLSRHGEQGFRIEVIDDGPGIPPAERERVFEAFHRGNADDPRPGTGIGLALVAEFARLQGGHAWAEPSDHGAHLVVEIPAPAP